MGVSIPFIFNQFLFQIPIFLVIGMGLILAIVRWKTAPHAMLLVALGLTLYGLQMVVWDVLNVAALGFPYGSPGFYVLRIVTALWQAVCFGLIVAGAFIDRQSAARGFPIENTFNPAPPVYPRR